MQKILLIEDRESIAFPECHAMGLIEFCQKNKRLHIERRVNIWRNILPAGSDNALSPIRLYHIIHWDSVPLPEARHNIDDVRFAPGQLHSTEISHAFGVWIEEGLAIFNAGMPSGSFSLVFDGDCDPVQSSEVFDLVIRDAAWQEAMDEWCKQRSIIPSFLKRRDTYTCVTEGFPRAIKGIVEKSSFTSCNFPVGSLCDVKQILDGDQSRTLDEWDQAWLDEHELKTFQTAPPLPSWIELRLDKVIQEDDDPEYPGYTALLYEE